MFHPGDVLRKWRNERGIGIVALAKLAKIDKGTISKIENGGSYRQPTFEKLCQAFEKKPIDVYIELVERNRGSVSTAASICPDNNPDHISYHATFEDVLHGDPQIAGVAIDCLKAFAARIRAGPKMKISGGQ